MKGATPVTPLITWQYNFLFNLLHAFARPYMRKILTLISIAKQQKTLNHTGHNDDGHCNSSQDKSRHKPHDEPLGAPLEAWPVRHSAVQMAPPIGVTVFSDWFPYYRGNNVGEWYIAPFCVFIPLESLVVVWAFLQTHSTILIFLRICYKGRLQPTLFWPRVLRENYDDF